LAALVLVEFDYSAAGGERRLGRVRSRRPHASVRISRDRISRYRMAA
jgi:hypothetical protein